MAELEVDQSNLPRVQEVCQCFAVLEDGALAHNLQEQEIEQYYNSNVQRSQLVQRDIRVAKRLQDEEEDRAQMLQHQATHQLEERDSEYARMIQEEIQRCADEAWRREVEDEEIAKRIQEEEEVYLRHRSSYQNKDGRGPALRSGMAALDLGELEKVLLDEELARRLQEEEERSAEETQQGPSPHRRDCPIGDFRAAQVAQDEEIARFMQKQEITAKRRSRELEPVREYWENDRRTACDRQRRRLDAEGLQSPFDDFTPDNQLPSHISVTMQPQAIRNIAEELDPTFQRKDSAESGQMNGFCQNQTSQQVGLKSPLEEPTFVPPTKRQSDKLERVKPKEKKENAKEKENCKQQ
ncbi:coiled-coil domain-containing protein 50-like isoform X3 [Sinocyclocheilus rhinocerous]|uniref:coiled-coil domain-containing protein 50-like isoform X3 n=1 Tax=Sinocyclocheilus rhinocerous TaxID=307959 RepID=UPI0007B81113|nr:PREDICTED: coiled-coil domain-containing protein 50-like isoform X3 [Sinocyclocheilus rhinocerous]